MFFKFVRLRFSPSARRSVADYISLLHASRFPRHHLPDISRTVQHSDAVRVASVEELNPVEVDKGHLFNVQYRRGPGALNLRFDLIQSSDRRSPLSRTRSRDRSIFRVTIGGSRLRRLGCTPTTICKLLKRSNLYGPDIRIFQQFLIFKDLSKAKGLI